jgi:hypothetical protein
MIKHLTIPVFGFAVLVGAAAPAAADHSRSYWVTPRYDYTYQVPPQKKVTNQSQHRKFNPKLDFETEAVWRNLRPEWFAE